MERAAVAARDAVCRPDRGRLRSQHAAREKRLGRKSLGGQIEGFVLFIWQFGGRGKMIAYF
jgi:hypothetical protein